LTEICFLAGIQHPHDARDFVRLLSALLKAQRFGCTMEMLLDVADRRTLNRLMDRSGVAGDATAGVWEFLERQTLIPRRHEVLRLLREPLGVYAGTSPQPIPPTARVRLSD
jgi:hypothetical protein